MVPNTFILKTKLTPILGIVLLKFLQAYKLLNCAIKSLYIPSREYRT